MTQSTTSTITTEKAIKYTEFHPARKLFLTINSDGHLICYKIGDKKPFHTSRLQGIVATWYDDGVFVASDDLRIFHIYVEGNILCVPCKVSAPPTSILAEKGKLIVGTKIGKCEVFSVNEALKCTKLHEIAVGRGGSGILSMQWVSSLDETPDVDAESPEQTTTELESHRGHSQSRIEHL